MRIFDALNDPRNMEAAMKYVKEYGGLVEAAISYTKSPVHSEDYFVKLAMQLEKMGADTICIKDMANLLLPYDAYSLVKKLKENVGVPIHLHTHNTTGTGDMTNLMAAQAGVDIVDTALSPLANGTSQPRQRPWWPPCRVPAAIPAWIWRSFRSGRSFPRRCREAGYQPQGPEGGCKHPVVSGARRHAVQPDLPAEAGQCRG